jgi:Ca2+-transporting ATPase
MKQPPRNTAEHLVARQHIAMSLTQGALTTLVVALLYGFALHYGEAAAEARSMAFIALVVANCMLIFSSRSLNAGLGNALQALTATAGWVIGGTLAALLAVTAVPVLAAPFAFGGLGVAPWLTAAAIGLLSWPLFEAAKVVVSQRGTAA